MTGRLRIREWDNGERKGTTIDVEAEAIGHDLAWGSTTFTRTISSSAAPAPEAFPSEQSLSEAEQGSAPDEASLEVTIEPQPLAPQFAEPEAAVPF